MTVLWRLFTTLSLICYTESKCSPTSYYKNCWIRRFSGLFVDIEESQRRGAQLLKFYQEDSALKCSRACCLTRNFSCNLAVYHFNTTQDSVNCFHLHCPSLESCILRYRGNVILYNVTKGVDPDLLVFGKYFTSNVRLWPHMASSKLNASEPLVTDKRHFSWPPVQPLTYAQTKQTSTTPQRSSQQTSSTISTTITETPKNTTPNVTLSTSATPLLNAVTTITLTHHSSVRTALPTQTTRSYTTTTSKTTSTPLTVPPPQHTTASPPETNSSYITSLTVPANIEGDKPYPNDTKGYISRNYTTTDGQPPDGGDLTPVWHLATSTALVVLVACATLLFGCCCSVLLGVSWRGRRRRKGRYRTAWRGKRGSMRLIKYVIVRESF
ncbi:MANSC domain-containing protein 4 [Chanos chanos]|uniref:MANSC domain-containing protein 4 n=1 Tax=Chanos chanos TaxID=29144 RepID=A0A6J2V6T3_CHACN|nr:MANSC domain-containing protein 4 [Chanos chanos]